MRRGPIWPSADPASLAGIHLLFRHDHRAYHGRYGDSKRSFGTGTAPRCWKRVRLPSGSPRDETDPSGALLPPHRRPHGTDGAFKTGGRGSLRREHRIRLTRPDTEGRVGKFTEFDRTKPRFDYTFSGTRYRASSTGPGGHCSRGHVNAATPAGYATTASAVTTDGHYSLFIPPGRYTFVVAVRTTTSELPTTLRFQLQLSAADTTIDFDASRAYEVSGVGLVGGRRAAVRARTSRPSPSVTGIDASNRTGSTGPRHSTCRTAIICTSASPPDLSIVSPVVGHWLISGAGSASPSRFPANSVGHDATSSFRQRPDQGFANVTAHGGRAAERYRANLDRRVGPLPVLRGRANTGYTLQRVSRRERMCSSSSPTSPRPSTPRSTLSIDPP